MPRCKLLDSERCLYTTLKGRRCAKPRMPEHGVCYYHFRDARIEAAKKEASSQAAQRLLPAASTFERPSDVADFLAAVVREVIEGHLSPSHASALTYLGQTILASMNQKDRPAAADAPAPPPDEATLQSQFDNLAAAISSALQPAPTHSTETAP